MPSRHGIIDARSPRGRSVPVQARVVGANDQPVLQSNVSSIAYVATDVSSGQTVASGTLTVSAVVFDTLRTDCGWHEGTAADPWVDDDNEGYNFRTVLPASITTGPGNRVRVMITLTMTDAAKVVVQVDLRIE